MTIAVVFGGQGSQRPGMASRWTGHPAGAQVLASASEVLGFDVVRRWDQRDGLADVAQAQLAVFVCGLASFRALTAAGVRPVAVAGHSLGEYTALVAAGALSFESALRAVGHRAQVMARAGRDFPGGMLVLIGAAASDVATLAVQRFSGSDEPSDRPSDQAVLVVANHNAPAQLVLAGTASALDFAAGLAAEHDVQAVRLRVAGAFHSPLMRRAARQLDPVLAALTFSPPELPVIPNLDGVPTQDPDRLAGALRAHMLAPVRWAATSAALGALGTRLVAECGASRVLGPLVQQVCPSVGTVLVRTIDDLGCAPLHHWMHSASAA